MRPISEVASKKILVVDDDPYIREIITIVLESEGYKVFGLDNGSLVVETVQHIWPDIILIDVNLGDCDGRDICREMKQLTATKSIPIMIISGNSVANAYREKQCHAEDFLLKPFDVSELLEHVKRLAA